MADAPFERVPPSPDAPAIGSIPINYTADQVQGTGTWTKRARGLLISTAGTLKVDWADGSTDTLVLGVGVYAFVVTKIYQTGSTAAVGNILF